MSGTMSRSSVLVHSRCYNKGTINWVAYKQQEFISHSSKGCKFKITAPVDLGANKRPQIKYAAQFLKIRKHKININFKHIHIYAHTYVYI